MAPNSRYFRSRRGRTNSATAGAIVVSSVLVAMGFWRIGTVLFALAIAVTIFTESSISLDTNWTIREVRRSVNRQGGSHPLESHEAGLTLEDMQWIESALATNAAKSSLARTSNPLASESLHITSMVPSVPVVPSLPAVSSGYDRTNDWIDEWITRNSFGPIPVLTTKSAKMLSNAIKRTNAKRILYVGSADGAYWIGSEIQRLGKRGIYCGALVTDPVSVSGSLEYLRKFDKSVVAVERLTETRSPASSIAGLTAHLTEEIYMDLGSIDSAVQLYEMMPEKFMDWLRPDVPVTVVNSKDHDVRRSLEKLLNQFQNFRIISINDDHTVASIMKASK